MSQWTNLVHKDLKSINSRLGTRIKLKCNKLTSRASTRVCRYKDTNRAQEILLTLAKEKGSISALKQVDKISTRRASLLDKLPNVVLSRIGARRSVLKQGKLKRRASKLIREPQLLYARMELARVGRHLNSQVQIQRKLTASAFNMIQV